MKTTRSIGIAPTVWQRYMKAVGFILAGLFCIFPPVERKDRSRISGLLDLAWRQLATAAGFERTSERAENFHTENPARIALDLPGVTNGLKQKTVPINVGAAQSVQAVEAAVVPGSSSI